MSEENSVNYSDGEIVWVKLDGHWWPGEVCNKKNDITYKKPPIAIVKFFDENNYQDIRKPDHIYPYQCELKKSFIKKSLTSTRIKADDLKKLKKDIINAEIKTGGNEKILNDKEFFPEQEPRINIVQQLFGTPKKETLKRKKKQQSSKGYPITHKRFIMGTFDDYKEMILLQSIGKDRIQDDDDDDFELDEIRKLNEPVDDVLLCKFCGLRTISADILMVHTTNCFLNHKKGGGKSKKTTTSQKRSPKTPKTKEKTERKTKPKEKVAKQPAVKKTPKKEPKQPLPPPELNTSDDLEDLVNDWDDEVETTPITTVPITKEINHKTAESDNNAQNKSKENAKDTKEKENCFEFNENEDDKLKNTSPVRASPVRASPVRAKNAKKSPENNSTTKEKDEEVNDDDFNSLMETTQAPDVSNLLKSQQNFPYAKTIKIPDKPEPSKSPTRETKPRMTIPKKRILDNFEQQQLNENTATTTTTTTMSSSSSPKKESPKKPLDEEEEQKVPQKGKNEEDSVQITELRKGIMSKLMHNTKKTRLGMHSIRTRSDEKKEEEQEVNEKPVEEKPPPPTIETKSETQPRRFFPSRQKRLSANESKDVKIEVKQIKQNKEAKEEVKEIKEIKENKETSTPVVEQTKEDVKETNEDVKETKEEVKKSNIVEIKENENKMEEVKESPKKVEEKPKDEEMKISEEPKNKEPVNEIIFKSANKDSNDDFNISIKTNLTNLSKAEEMSALTLATLSSNIPPVDNKLPEKIIETPTSEPESIITTKPLPPPIDESELVPIEGNVTIVPEKVLADGEVELTTNAQPTATLMNFSMDYSDSSNSMAAENTKIEPPAVVKKPTKKSYERRELLDILEGTQNQDKKQPVKETECDFDDMIPSQIITPKSKEPDNEQQSIHNEKSKLMERLTTSDKLIKVSTKTKTYQKVVPLGSRSQISTTKSNKPIILSEEIIKPANIKKRQLEDDHHTVSKKLHIDPKTTSSSSGNVGKAKILQQTIITPAGEIIQPATQQQQQQNEDISMFDINSMPIVLSDEILTPESIENMPIMLQNETAQVVTTIATPVAKDKILLKKQQTPQLKQQQQPNKLVTSQIVQQKNRQQPRILHTVSNKIITTTNANASPKSNKYVIVSQSPQTKKSCIIKKSASELQQQKQEFVAGASGNKIMFVTNQQGQQQRVVLTPQQQQRLGYQNSKQIVKGNIIQKNLLNKETTASTSGLIKKQQSNILKTQSSHQIVSTSGGKLGSQLRTTKTLIKTQPQQQQIQKVYQKPQKTIVIKDQQGHIVRKIQGNDDALLEQQVAEQIQAIKQQQMQQQQQQQKPKPEILNYRVNQSKTGFRRSYSSKSKQQALIKPIMQQSNQKTEPTPPPLAPLSPEKKEIVPTTTTATTTNVECSEKAGNDRPLKQHIIQDATGHLTSVTEGQILALQLDGESYMLVTCDESGNFTPLNNEALTQLGPNLPTDLGNIVLQYQKEDGTTIQAAEEPALEEKKAIEEVVSQQEIVDESPTAAAAVVVTTAEETVKTEINEAAAGGQQLIVTGDPIAAQKFLESLTEGNTDLSNILANAEGSFLIETGGQQILINTENQMILPENEQETTGEQQQQEQKFQVPDILAAALADTGVQQEQQQQNNKIAQLSPNGTNMYPISGGGSGGGGGGPQLSLSLNSPIMSPQVQPSTNNKKIADDETDILTQIPKNVDLPITITDPNISGKVAPQQQQQQQVTTINNIELNDSAIISSVQQSMNNSPSQFVYSLPTLDDTVDLGGQKTFNSMPLLTEDVEEQTSDCGVTTATTLTTTSVSEQHENKVVNFDLDDSKNTSEGGFMDDEGLCSLGGGMCSSLSEPPPEMFAMSPTGFITNVTTSTTLSSTTDEINEHVVVHDDNFVLSNNGDDDVQQQQLNSSEENSCEIPIQPEIVVSHLTSSDNSNNTFETNTITESIDDNSTNCKFD